MTAEAEAPVEQVARSLPLTQWVVADMTPLDWRHVADFLTGILNRAPLKDGPGWLPERLILGCLATELRQNAIAAGEPPEEYDDPRPLWIETQRWPHEQPYSSPSPRLRDADIAAAATRT